MPRRPDGLKRWESFRFVAGALRAYIDGKPFHRDAEPDWPGAIELASQQLVSPAVGLVLSRDPDVPDDVKEYFAAVIALNGERNAILENAICDMAAALNRAGIVPLLLKGAANLLDGLYADPAARIMGDIDMLVPADAAAMASQVLATIGYPTVEVIAPPPRRWFTMAPRAHHLPMQANGETGAGVELHYELVGLDLVHLINAKDALARALPRTRNGVRYLVLCPTDRAMHNILHAQMHHGLHRKGLVDLRQMLDLAALIDACGGAIGWQEMEDRFAAAGAAAVLRYQGAVLRDIFGRDIPLPLPAPAATLARLRRALARRRTALTTLRDVAAYYWAGFRRQPHLALNFLNPVWWPQRIKLLRARYKP